MKKIFLIAITCILFASCAQKYPVQFSYHHGMYAAIKVKPFQSIVCNHTAEIEF